MITPDGWHDWAEKAPGKPSNRYSWNNDLSIIVLHSLEGNYATTRSPVWTGTVLYDGTLKQHFPVMAGLPHGGSNANPFGPGYEAEGGIVFDIEQDGEPLTDAQVSTYIRIISDLEAFTGRKYSRENGKLKEHGELALTACPSHRYEPLYAALEDDMTPAEVEDIVRKVFDKYFPPYYRTVTKQYWVRTAEGAYTDPPDEEVVAEITKACMDYIDEEIDKDV